MGKEKIFWRNNSFWSFFGLRNAFDFFLWRRASRAGFTLVELIVVIAMIGILSAVAFATLDPIGQMQKGWDAQRKSDLAQIQKALEQYYQDNGNYPRVSPGNISNPGAFQIRVGDDVVPWGGSFMPYMSKLPKERDSAKRYVYYPSSTRQAYWLYASLDRGGKDPQACTGIGNQCPNVPSGVICGDDASKICNYGVSSANVSP